MFGSGKKKKAIQLMREAEMCLIVGNETLAIKKFQESLQLNSNNPEAWNNLGAIHGGNNKHAEAKDCFEKSVRLRPDYVKAWRGLAVSEKNLKHYDRAMEICAKIENELGGNAEDIKADIIRRQEEGIEPPQGNPFDSNTAYAKHYSGANVRFTEVLAEMMSVAEKTHILPGKDIKHVPELCIEARSVVQSVLVALKENFIEREGYFNPALSIMPCLVFTIYAGMGAALEWDRDWPNLRDKGIFNKLIEKYGIFAMDEYVVEMYTGKAYDSKEGKELCEKVRNMAVYAVNFAIKGVQEKNTLEEFSQQLMEGIQEVGVACYWFGVSFAMYKIVGYNE